MFTVYILYSKSFDRYYVGYTNDIERRISEHNRKKHKFTDAGIPWILVHSENFISKKEAMMREKFIKAQKSKQFIINLVAQR
jgi:putative endonuclease